MVAQNYEMDFTETNVSIYPESQNLDKIEEIDGAQVECWKCDGSKLNKNGKKPCRKCHGKGFI